MGNDYLDFYGEHHISPVRQDISNIELHYERRRKLYRQCGIPLLAFRDARILEVGPGGGYNTLAFFHWDCGHVDLVEANPRGFEDMQRLFAEQSIPQEKYDIISCEIEDYHTDKKYDIIIAEGFLPHLPNQKEIIEKLQKLAGDDGIIVITCVDHVSWFIEIMKRLLGWVLTREIQGYEQRLEFLLKLFEPQLAKLRGVSRPAKDWVQDNMLNPVTSNQSELGLGQAICLFENGYDVLGTSPHMFTDYSWHKDIWYDCTRDYKCQFGKKHLNLLMANEPEVILPASLVETAAGHFKAIRKLAAEYEEEQDMQCIERIMVHMDEMKDTICTLQNGFVEVFAEIRDALGRVAEGKDINMEEYPHFFGSFGRAQQYIAFAKCRKLKTDI